MTPIQPTPFETAQWIVEAHAEDMVGDMSEQEHDAYLAGLELVCDGMDVADLRRALGAVVDIVQEFMFELADAASRRTGFFTLSGTDGAEPMSRTVSPVTLRRLARSQRSGWPRQSPTLLSGGT